MLVGVAVRGRISLARGRSAPDKNENVLVTDASNIEIKALTVGTVASSAHADLAVTHGELVDKRAVRGSKPEVRAVYVRVWQRSDRSWRVLHDFLTPVMP